MRVSILVDPLSYGSRFIEACERLNINYISIYTVNIDRAAKYGSQGKTKNNQVSEYFSANDSIIPVLVRLGLEIESVIPCSEPGVNLAEEIAKHFNLPRNLDNFRGLRRSKLLMRQKAIQDNIAQPDFCVIECSNEMAVTNVVENFQNDRPCIIKAILGAGGDGVFYSDSNDKTLEIMDNLKGSSNLFGITNTQVLIEEYIEGSEFAVNLIRHKGVTIFCDIWSYERQPTKYYFNSYKNAVSRNISIPEFEKLKSRAEEVADKFGILNGAAHIEFILDNRNNEIYFVEIGARLPGAGMSDLWKAEGFDPYECLLRIYSNNFDSTQRCIRRVDCNLAIVFLSNFAEAGLVEDIHGLKQIAKLDSFVKMDLRVDVKHRVGITTDLASNVGYLLLKNKDEVRLEEDIEAAHDLFKLEIDSSENDIYQFDGQHVFGEFYGVSPSILNNLNFLEESLVDSISKGGATLCSIQSKKFSPSGVTILALLSESHASIHTYPEHSAMFFDIFTCGDHCYPTRIARRLEALLKPQETFIKESRRGREAEIVSDSQHNVETNEYLVPLASEILL